MKWSEYYFQETSRWKFQSHRWYDWCHILGSCCLFLIAMQDSLRYCFVDDNDSWLFFDKPWIWKFQYQAKDSIFRDRSIENSLKYFLRWNFRGCWLSNFQCLYFDIRCFNHQNVYTTDSPSKKYTFFFFFPVIIDTSFER